MRVKLPKKDLFELFAKISERKEKLSNLALLLNVKRRTLNSWKFGKTTMPFDIFKKIVNFTGLKYNDLDFKILPDFWHIRESARKGAYARMRLYGNIGTPEGRRKGGLASLITHKRNHTLFNNIKSISRPKKSEELAEFIGIIFGDGHLSKYQISITTNSKTDKEHAEFTKKLINDLFKVRATIKHTKNENALSIVASSKNLVRFLNKNGMPIGNKIKNNLSIPRWIIKKNYYKKAFIRGVFNTDGCIYLDTHKNQRKNLQTPRMGINKLRGKIDRRNF